VRPFFSRRRDRVNGSAHARYHPEEFVYQDTVTMSDSLSPMERLDRTALSISPLFDNSDEARYWSARSGAERLRHVETLRRINYGARATEGLQRVLELAPVPWR
jgi:hypothetical protein